MNAVELLYRWRQTGNYILKGIYPIGLVPVPPGSFCVTVGMKTSYKAQRGTCVGGKPSISSLLPDQRLISQAMICPESGSMYDCDSGANLRLGM